MIKPALILALLPSLGWADVFPQSLVVPGGIAAIPVGSLQQAAPEVYYEQNRVLVTKRDQQWLALVGIGLATAPGMQTIQVNSGQSQSEISFLVLDKHYPEQRLTIENKRMVDEMSPADLKRIESEKITQELIKSTWSSRDAATHFSAPVDGRLSSLFGLKRFFNNVARQPHNGLDIAAPAGTAILAPAAGTVIGTGNFFFNGNSVFLDHGQGLLSVYLHMTKIEVETGQTLQAGQRLGTVGATGRVTGPHLHWIIYLNKQAVDPALFISEDLPRLAARNQQP